MNMLLACVADVSFPFSGQVSKQANKHAWCEKKMGRSGGGAYFSHLHAVFIPLYAFANNEML